MKNSEEKLEISKDRKKHTEIWRVAPLNKELTFLIGLKFCFVFKINITSSFHQVDVKSLCGDSFTVLSDHQANMINHLSRENDW